MLLIEAKPIYRYVYHIAPKSELNRIKKVGLRSFTRSPNPQWSHIKYNHPSVFVVTRKTKDVLNELLSLLTNKHITKPNELETWTDKEWEKFINSYVLLTIDLSKCSNPELLADPNMAKWTHSKILIGNVPSDSIVNIEPVKFDWS